MTESQCLRLTGGTDSMLLKTGAVRQREATCQEISFHVCGELKKKKTWLNPLKSQLDQINDLERN